MRNKNLKVEKILKKFL